MRDRFHHHLVNPHTPPISNSGVWRRLFERLLRSQRLSVLFTIDETLSEFYLKQDVKPPGFSRLKLLRGEPVELSFVVSKDEARRRLGIPVTGKMILFYGNVDKRKGIIELLKAFTELHTGRTDIYLLVLGNQGEMKQEIDLAALEARRSTRLIELDRFATASDESLAFSAADLVWVGYSAHHGPSGVLGKAASVGLPVIGCQEGTIGWAVSRYNLGVAVDVSSIGAVTAAIETIMYDSVARERFRAGAIAYAQGRTDFNFRETILNALEMAGTW